MNLIIQSLFGRRKRVVSPKPVLRRRLSLADAALHLPVYAIGDVHGRLDLLREVERKIARDLAEEGTQGFVVLLGDYIDRGPDSAGVVDHLLRAAPANQHRVVLCGNHEAAFLDFIENPGRNKWWLEFGGRQTLLSYGIDADYFFHRGRKARAELVRSIRDTVPRDHLDFLASLPVCARFGRYLFVHAGVRPGIPLERQSDHDMMWIREPFLSDGPKLGSLVVIHGHTPVLEPQVGKARICIDTGAVTTGNLTVLKIAAEKALLLS